MVNSKATRQRLQKIGAEMVGTYALIFAGCGAIMVDAQSGGAITHLGIGLVFGLVIAVMIYATGHISGAHFNPAVTIAFAAIGQFPWRDVPGYVIGQIVATILASGTLLVLLGPVANMGMTLPTGTVDQALGFETVLTFMLMFVITAVATDGRAQGQMAGLAIGGTVAIAAIFAGPVCGASMNPARSLGPAIVAGNLSQIWIYLAGPVVGALLGAFTYQFVRCTDESDSGAAGCC